MFSVPQAYLALWVGGQRGRGEGQPWVVSRWHSLDVAGTTGPKVTSAHLGVLCN